MRFFLVGRDRESGEVRIVSGQTFATRQEALDSLSTVVPADGSFDESDLFVVDLDTVTPVVVYRASAPSAASGEDAIADAWEAPEERPLDEALTAGLLEPVDEAIGDVAVAQSGDEGLADALRRAAIRMESEGVQPAPTVEEVIAAQTVAEEPADEAAAVEPADEPEPDVAETPVDQAVAESPAPEDASEGLLSISDLPAPEPVVEPTADEQVAAWPWEASTDAALPVAVDPASEQFRPSGIEEAAASVSDMLPAPKDDFTPRPVIMGDYAEGSSAPAPDALEPDEGAPQPDVLSAPANLEDLGIPAEWLDEAEPVVEAATDAEAEGEATGETASGEADDDTPVVEAADEPVDAVIAAPLLELDTSAADTPAYQPTSIDLDSYTCEDCVYAGTCPKAGQDSPASCGSFQWKSM